MRHIARDIIRKIVPNSVREYITPITRVSEYYFSYLFGSGRANPPNTVVLEVTYICNCHCKMCPLYVNEENVKDHLDMKDEELPADKWKSIIDELSDFGVRNLIFTGGEPFMRKDLLDILDHAKSRGLYVSIITNGSLVTQEVAARLVSLKVDNVSVSLDGPKEIHNKIRQKDIFDSAMQGVDFLLEEKKRKKSELPDLQFSCVISTMNQTSLSELIKIGHEKQIPVYYHRITFTTYSMEQMMDREYSREMVKAEDQNLPANLVNVDPDKLESELNKIKETAKRYPVFYSIFLGSHKEIVKAFYKSDFSFINKCFYPWNNSRINPYGIVYPCSINAHMGDLNKGRFDSIWNGVNYVNFRRRLKKKGLFSICSKCCVLDKDRSVWNILPRI
ncbi:MAG: radical SAM protein [Candidatus Omnitrophica bacterium]|nr:radical SAM protein [Candidatus Omnitrophota bacterium]